jgi:hypothetical protein
MDWEDEETKRIDRRFFLRRVKTAARRKTKTPKQMNNNYAGPLHSLALSNVDKDGLLHWA